MEFCTGIVGGRIDGIIFIIVILFLVQSHKLSVVVVLGTFEHQLNDTHVAIKPHANPGRFSVSL